MVIRNLEYINNDPCLLRRNAQREIKHFAIEWWGNPPIFDARQK
jgi:hypothetical protein